MISCMGPSSLMHRCWSRRGLLYCWIGHYIDHYTKLNFFWPQINKSVDEVAHNLTVHVLNTAFNKFHTSFPGNPIIRLFNVLVYFMISCMGPSSLMHRFKYFKYLKLNKVIKVIASKQNVGRNIWSIFRNFITKTIKPTVYS
jgi:hypothetical protein